MNEEKQPKEEKGKSPGLFDRLGKKKTLLVLFGGLCGFLLLFLGNSSLFTQMQKQEDTTVSEEEAVNRYREDLEKEIKELCESVTGVGSATVSVSLSSGYVYVYATEEGANGKSFVILGSGSSASALLLSKEPPQIAGIGVVCKGGDNDAVKSELTMLLSAAYHVPSNRIYIAPAK